MTVATYPAGIQIRFDFKSRISTRGDRAQCRSFSRRSKQNLLWRTANDTKFRPTFMLVCTYHGIVQSGKRAKADLNRYLVQFRRKFPLVKYLWIAEFQRRGSLHFHIFVDVPLTETYRLTFWHWKLWTTASCVPDADRAGLLHCAWSEALRVAHAVVWYCMKECAKQFQKVLPVGVQGIGRWWGMSRSITKALAEKIYEIKSYLQVPWVEELVEKYFRTDGELTKLSGRWLAFGREKLCSIKAALHEMFQPELEFPE